MRYKFVLAYEGTAYSGWQIQCKPSPPPTVQGAVEAALFTLSGERARVTASGRTDAGVHALAQVAHADLDRKINDLRHSLNAVLPPDIRVISAEQVADCFHARKDALHKTYYYDFWPEESFTPPFARNFVWACGKLDVGKMRSVLPGFLGEHDFASFQNAGTKVKSTVRKILDISISQLPSCAYFPSHEPALRLCVTATGFLKQMARNMAGFLWHVGTGKSAGENLARIFAACSRQALPSPTAPAQGLFLAHVGYPSGDKGDLQGCRIS